MTGWAGTRRKDRFTFEMVDPFDLSASRGFIGGVDLSSAEVTYGYYTDSRVSAGFDAVDPGYIEGSLIRVHHYVDEWDFYEPLGTFFVREAAQRRGCAEVTSFSLASTLTRISDDFLVQHYAIPAGAYAKAVLADLLGRYNVDHSISASCGDSRYAQAKVYEFGENVLSTVFEVCDKMRARLDVDGYGTATVSPYVPPSARAPVFTFSQENGTIVGDIEETSDLYEAAGRAGVVAKDGDSEVSGYADVAASSPASYSRRGRRKTVIYREDELSPFTKGEAGARARRYLDDGGAEAREYAFESVYVPMSAGDVAEIVIGGEPRKAMLKSRSVGLSPGMTCRNTFKEV